MFIVFNQIKVKPNQTQIQQFSSSVTRYNMSVFQTGPDVLNIDGSVLEGGGQILRMAMVFSGLLHRPIHVFNIRAGRVKPGLAAQHLNGLIVAKDICQGRLENAHIGSTEIIFYPGNITSGNFYADSKTAGSVTLIMQVALPLLLFSSGQSQLIVKGGTNADMAPPIDYYIHLWRPVFCHFFNFNIDIHDVRRGFFPKGGGEVNVDVTPVQYIRPIELTQRGELTAVWGHAFVAGGVKMNTAQTMADTAYDYLVKSYPDFKTKLKITTYQLSSDKAIGNGSGVYIFAATSTGARYSGGCNGSPRTSPGECGLNAAKELWSSLCENICFDEHTQDQLIVMMALAKGTSRVRVGQISLHTRTAIHIAELMTSAKFNIIEHEDKSCIIECQGMGFVNKNWGRKTFH